MLKNDLSKDVDMLIANEGLTLEKVGKIIGATRQGVFQAKSAKTLSKKFVEIVDALGYDIEIVYRRRDTE